MKLICASLVLLFITSVARLAVGQGNSPRQSSDSDAAGLPPASSSAPKARPAAPTTAATALTFSPGAFSGDQIRELIQKVVDNDIENDKKQRNYTYIQREEERKLNRKGEVQSTASKTSEVMILYGSQVERLIAKNDKPLSEKEAAQEDEKIRKIIEKRQNESEEKRKKRLQQEEKDREESRQWVREISDAYNFRLAGTENVGGRDSYVVDADPRTGFQPHLKYANYLSKFRFRVWIDRAEMQLVKMDAECIDTVSWGLFVARIHKGARILVEQTRVNDEVWLPKHESVKLDVRVALLKNFNVDQDTTYRDYKKFRTDTKIVGVGEVQEEK
jgi:hypothetical protein